MSDTRQLLSDYANGSEAAFRELVDRYVNLVYSAARRLVNGDAHLAEDVTQMVFSDLARQARSLAPEVMLGGWLHQRAFHVATTLVRTERRRQDRERRAAEMNLLHDSSGDSLGQLTPFLDEAIIELNAEDRKAILLRFFEQREFRVVGEALGLSEDAARMRVNRALEKLHLLLEHRGVTLSAAALGTVLAADAVTAAPVGLAFSAASAALTSTAVSTTAASTAIAAATRSAAMTTLQKTLATATVAVLAGAGIYEAREAAHLRDRVQTLQQREAPLAERIHHLNRERDEASNRIVALREQNERLNRSLPELLRLRSEAARLQQELSELRKPAAPAATGDQPTASQSSTNQTQEALVFVAGEVNAPGPKNWIQGLKLTDALQLSRMTTPFAATNVTIKDSGGGARLYSLPDILDARSEDPYLKPGDIVFVPRSTGVLTGNPVEPQARHP